MEEKNSVKPIFLQKSKRFYKICVGLFLFSLFSMIVFKPLLSAFQGLLDLLIALPIFMVMFMAPVGLFYSWRSYKLKEGFSGVRLRYFIGHLVFCFIIVLFTLAIIKDIARLFL